MEGKCLSPFDYFTYILCALLCFCKNGGKKESEKRRKAKVCCKSRAVLLVGGISLTESASHFWLVLLHSLH